MFLKLDYVFALLFCLFVVVVVVVVVVIVRGRVRNFIFYIFY